MFVVSPAPNSWRQVAGAVARRLPELDVALLVVPCRQPEAMAAFVQSAVRTVFVCTSEEDRQHCEQLFPNATCVGKPQKTPPLAPASPFPLELMKVSAEMLTPGLRDCLRVARLARLHELAPEGKPICCVGGEGDRLDTAIVVVPGLRSDHADAHILETLCAPYEK